MSHPQQRIVVFSDDWGRHPSSCQHLITKLVDRFAVDWVNTVGTRRPSLKISDLRRGLGKLWEWTGLRTGKRLHANLRVHAPIMWPGFENALEERANDWLLRWGLRHVLPGRQPPVAVVTTIPLVASLAERTRHLHWIYYCVDAWDDFPGLSVDVMRRMERRLVRTVDRVVVTSDRLQERMTALGVDCDVLTHGVDPSAWLPPEHERQATAGDRPVALYWGHADSRLDLQMCLAVAECCELLFVGPRGDVAPELRTHGHVHWHGSVPMQELPAFAARADVLVMPYRDCPVTRAMQPLKLKEYLATGKPIVASVLPETSKWADAMDLASSPAQFARKVMARSGVQLPATQVRARKRLQAETWEAKAQCFERVLRSEEGVTTVLHCRAVSGSGGGPEKTILGSTAYLAEHGYRSLCAYLHSPDDVGIERIRQRAELSGCHFFAIPDRGPLDLSIVGRLAQLCQDHRVRIWHGHDYKSDLLGLILRRRIGLHLVATVHGWVHHTLRTPLYHAIDRRCLRSYDRVVPVSADLYDECLAFGVAHERLTLVENGIEIAAKGQRRPRARSGIVVGALGRLEEEKGFEVLIDATQELVEQGQDVRVLIGGEGSRYRALERRIARAGITGRARLLGYVDDVAEFLSQIDVFALSSLREGLPNVLLEAMAAGLPVVATRVGGVESAISPTSPNVLVDPGSMEALRDGLSAMLSDAARRRRAGSANRRHVRRQFSFAGRMDKMVHVYDSLFEQS